jgi:hypothetical protein
MKPRSLPLSLTSSQLAEVQAAAGLFRIDGRSKFLEDIAAQLIRLRRSPTNNDVLHAIQNCLAVRPTADIITE